MELKNKFIKHLIYSKKNRYPFVICDSNKQDLLSHTKPSITHEDFLVAMSLQGPERFTNTNTTQCVVACNKSMFILSRYYMFDTYGYTFQVISDSDVYESELITDKVLWIPGKLFKLVGAEKKLSVKINFNLVCVDYDSVRINMELNSSATSKFESESMIRKTNKYMYSDRGYYEQTDFIYKSFLCNRVFYNIMHSIKPEAYNKEVKFCVTSLPIFIETYYATKMTVDGIEFTEIEKFEIWKVIKDDTTYYIKTSKITPIKHCITEIEYICSVDVFKDDVHVGIGWIKYRNFEPQEKVIGDKLIRLFQPLERPCIEEFIAKKFPIESVLPSILFICSVFLFFIFIIVLIAVYAISIITMANQD